MQAQDNSQTGTKVSYEVALTMVNMSGSTIKASGSGVAFTLAIGTLGSA